MIYDYGFKPKGSMGGGRPGAARPRGARIMTGMGGGGRQRRASTGARRVGVKVGTARRGAKTARATGYNPKPRPKPGQSTRGYNPNPFSTNKFAKALIAKRAARAMRKREIESGTIVRRGKTSVPARVAKAPGSAGRSGVRANIRAAGSAMARRRRG